MPVHDWTRVQAGTFHDFHCASITHLKESLNDGLLPDGYYALSEQHAGRSIADVLTLRTPEASPAPPVGTGGLAVADAPPKVARRLIASPEASYRAARRTLTVRHASGHRIVALIEIVSPANKDRPRSVEEFIGKIDAALGCGCHVLLVDLLPPSPHDPEGMHGLVWEHYGPAGDDENIDGGPLTLASYVARPVPEGYVVRLGIGEVLPEMPLFLHDDAYVNVPLEPTYVAAHRGVPLYWREVLDGRRDPESR